MGQKGKHWLYNCIVYENKGMANLLNEFSLDIIEVK